VWAPPQDALALMINLGDGAPGALLSGNDATGDLCITPWGLTVDVENRAPAVVIEADLLAWSKSQGLPVAPDIGEDIYIGPCPPILRSAGRILGDLSSLDRNWLPIHDGLLAIVFNELNPSLWENSGESPFSAQVNRAIALIDARMQSPLSLNMLAQSAGWSPFHFARRFKTETGESPSRYLRLRRIERAQRLLIETQSSLCDIALACGFSSQSQMTTAFTTILGITPAKFRASGAPRQRLVRRPSADIRPIR
ncbi:MAG: helix-turn-helix transcriptional regulator, partial [Pseudomonadota bacterium]